MKKNFYLICIASFVFFFLFLAQAVVTPNEAFAAKTCKQKCDEAGCGPQQGCICGKCTFHATPTPKPGAETPTPKPYQCDPNVCKNGFHCTTEGGFSFCRAESGTGCTSSADCAAGLTCSGSPKKCVGSVINPTVTPPGFNCYKTPCGGGQCCTTDTGKTADGYCTTCTGKLDMIVCGTVTCDAATDHCCPSGCKAKGKACGAEPPTSCTDTSWAPDPAATCDTDSIEQTSNCGTKRTIGGTKVCSKVGACMEVKVFKKDVDGIYPLTPMTAAQLNSMKIGDTLRLTVKGSIANLQARFRVQFNGTPMFLPGAIVWQDSPNQRPRTGFVDPTTKLISYYEFVATRSGTYLFEGFVTSKPPEMSAN